MQPYTPRCIQNVRQAKDHDIKFDCSNDNKSKIKILDHKHAEGTSKNSQDNKVLRREFEGVDFRRWQKKMHFLLSSMSVVYVLTTHIPDDGDDATVDQIKKGPSGTMMIMSAEDSLKAKYMDEDASSKKFLVSNFTNHNMTDSRPVTEQYNELLDILGKVTQHKINMDDAIQVSCIIDKFSPSWKDFKHTLKHLKEELTLVELGSHLGIEEFLRMQDSDKPKGNNVVGPSVVNMVEHNNFSTYNDNKGATVHMCKDRCWFKNYESLNDGSILYMRNESPALVHRRSCVDFKFSSGKIVSLFNVLHVPNIRKNLVSSSVLNNCGYKQVIESNKFVLSKHGVFIGFGYLSNQIFRLNIVNDNIASAFMSTSKLNDSILWHARLGHVHFKRMQDMYKDGLISAFDMDTEKCKTCMLNKITKKSFQNVKRKTKVLELIHSDLCDLHATPSLGNKKYFVTFINDASRFYVIEPNESVSINLIIESKEAIFDDNRFSSVPRPSFRISNETKNIGGSVVLEEVTKKVVTQQPEHEHRKGKKEYDSKEFWI
nr:zinc finger, CCHC-type [Tanacetum cinerariifolium]